MARISDGCRRALTTLTHGANFRDGFGAIFHHETGFKMELENVMTFRSEWLQTLHWPSLRPQVFPCDKSDIPRTEQSISYEGRELSNEKATMEGIDVSGNAVLLLRRKISVGGRCIS